jgi:hypothetical protein
MSAVSNGPQGANHSTTGAVVYRPSVVGGTALSKSAGQGSTPWGGAIWQYRTNSGTLLEEKANLPQ